MDEEHSITNLHVSSSPLSAFPTHGTFHKIQVSPFPLMSRCNSSTLLTNLGLQYCSSRLGLQNMCPLPIKDPNTSMNSKDSGGRPYKSMENLNWDSEPDSGPNAFNCAPYTSIDSKFVFRCTASSHWYKGPPDVSGMEVYGVVPNPEVFAFYCQRCTHKKDLPLFPFWMLPGGMDEWDVRKCVREKLRMESTRSAAEPLKILPLRPQVANQGSCEDGAPSANHTAAKARLLCTRRITSPEDIKQEVLRRLQLRRQNSSPNLAQHSFSEICAESLKSSYTTESIFINRGFADTSPKQRRPPIGRLHIPTFEEFKRMRQNGKASPVYQNAEAYQRLGIDELDNKTDLQFFSGVEGGKGSSVWEERRVERAEYVVCALGTSSSTIGSSPVHTVPVSHSPMQPLVNLAPNKSMGAPFNRARRGSLDHVGPAYILPSKESGEEASSCCPALFLEGANLSSYGAKISKVKDGLIVSAVDLIKKSCSAELSAQTVTRLLANQETGCDVTTPSAGCQSLLVSLATSATACKAEPSDETVAAGRGESAERVYPSNQQGPGRGSRRSSSDAACEPAGRVRAQRECHLRPHGSDPMPADAARLKQLEMKLAAAALTDHRRDRHSAPAALRGHSEPPDKERSGRQGVMQSVQPRWSTLSSLSADSGVLGLHGEREEEDNQPHQCLRNQVVEVERVDSGIVPGLALRWKKPAASVRTGESQRHCPDCSQREGASKERGKGMCERCSKLRIERKEAILEFFMTESSYGEDLRIIKEEFYSPMQAAGLLTAEQLAMVFGNVQELIDVNDRFTEHLQDSIDQAFDQGDEDLLTVCIGEIFLEFVNMLPAFQTYCLQQPTAVNTLNTLEKEKELLRIFLDVSQNDNTALRRMNLRSFLIAPLQRVTKYPLLLSRISKATTECHPDYTQLREAKSHVESHLEHINMKTKQECTGVTWSLRSFRRDSRKNREVINIEMREVSLKTVGWARESTRFVMEGPLQLSQPADGQWVRKGIKALKFQNIQSLLMVRTQRTDESSGQGVYWGEQGNGAVENVGDGVLVLIKDKSSGKFSVMREPIRLENCVVSTDPDFEDTFEVLDIRRESFIFQALDKSRTQQWFRQIRRYARELGSWRKRRNALPNIMINTNHSRS